MSQSCGECNAPALPDHRFCGHCGNPLPEKGGGDAPTPKGSLKRLLGLGGLVVLGLGILLAISPQLFGKALQALSIGLMIMSVVVVFRTFRKPRKLSFIGLVVMMISSVVSFLIFVHGSGIEAFHSDSTYQGVFWGLVVGFLWSFTNRLLYDNGKVKTKGNLWYLIIWLAVFCLTQLIPFLTGRPPTLMVPVMAASMGMIWTNNGLLILRLIVVYGFSKRLRESKEGA